MKLLLALRGLLLLAPAVLVSQAAPRSITLPEAIALAQRDGHDARAARASREAAHLRNSAFRSRQLPQLSLAGTVPSYNRSIIEVQQPDGTSLFRPRNQTNANLNLQLSQRLPVTGGDLFISSSLARLSVSGTQAFETWSSTPFQVGIRQDIFRPNNAAWDGREQELDAEVSEQQYLEAREEIALEVTGLFFDVFSARMGLDNAVTNVAVNDTLYRLNQGRFEVGRIGENDLLQSELALLRTRTSLDGARLEYDRALAALRLGLGLGRDDSLTVVVGTPTPSISVDTARAVREALANQSAVAGVRLQEVRARRSVNAARLSNGVGATVQASYGFNATGNGFDAAYNALQEARQFSVGVQIPLWQWGVKREAVGAALADEERVLAEGESALAQVALDAHFAALQVEQSRRALELSAKADTVAGKRFEVAYNRYVIGRIAIDNLYVAQSEKDQALVQYVQALRNYWLSYYRLRRLTLYDFAAGEPIR
jgi:outer membrane protein TolC